MRDLNECKAEVFARSEKRIKEKKVKRRLLIISLVSCVCLVVLSSAIIPKLLPAPVESAPNFSDNKEAQSPSAPQFEGLEIESANSKSSVSNEETINEIYASLKELDVSSDSSSISSGNGLVYGVPKPTPYTPDADFVITFSFQNGEELIYSIKGNLLINENTQNEVTLTEAELGELLKSINP